MYFWNEHTYWQIPRRLICCWIWCGYIVKACTDAAMRHGTAPLWEVFPYFSHSGMYGPAPWLVWVLVISVPQIPVLHITSGAGCINCFSTREIEEKFLRAGPGRLLGISSHNGFNCFQRVVSSLSSFWCMDAPFVRLWWKTKSFLRNDASY